MSDSAPAPSSALVPPVSAPSAKHRLAPPRPLSESLVWSLQRAFFDQLGPDAWRRAIVPQYITSNVFTARSCARILAAHLADLAAEAGDGKLDPSEPVYLLELGAGSGRFAFHVLHALGELVPNGGEGGVRFTYVLSDVAERNIAAWEAQPSFRRFIEQGRLDFARFDGASDDTVLLRRSGIKLVPGALRNPLVVIANYLFDSIPLDAFRIADGLPHLGRVALESPDSNARLDDPALLESVELAWEFDAAPSTTPYGLPEIDALLTACAARLPDSILSFPVAALSACARLRALANGRLFLLTSDLGYFDKGYSQRSSPPAMGRHGSVSFQVNYEVIAEWFLSQSDQSPAVLSSPHRPDHLVLAAFHLDTFGGVPLRARHAFAEQVASFGPDEFFSLKKAVERSYPNMSLRELIAWLRLSGPDPHVYRQCEPRVMELARTSAPHETRELRLLADELWAAYYHTGEAWDLPFALGNLLFTIHCEEDALEYFRRSIELYGPRDERLINLALCYYELGERAPALGLVERVLTDSPNNETARALQSAIQSDAR